MNHYLSSMAEDLAKQVKKKKTTTWCAYKLTKATRKTKRMLATVDDIQYISDVGDCVQVVLTRDHYLAGECNVEK